MHTRIMHDVAAAVREHIAPSEKGDAVLFSDSRYAAVPFSPGHFHPIVKEAAVNEAAGGPTGGSMAFVDGGNLEILAAPSFSLQFIRVYATVYRNNRRSEFMLFEQYALIRAMPADGAQDIHYRVKLFPLSKKSLPVDESALVFDSMDPALRHGHFRVDISRIGDITRDILELAAARLAVETLSAGDCVIRDGTLQASYAMQEHHFARLFAAAHERGVTVVSVAKTCDLFCASGRSLLGAIAQLAAQQPHAMWHYTPLVEIRNERHPAVMALAKLHPRSSHIFRCEIHKDDAQRLPQLMVRLAQNSRDPIFLGYPYGLVDADQFARVSQKDGEHLAMRFMAQCSREWPDILPFINAGNAHAILDDK